MTIDEGGLTNIGKLPDIDSPPAGRFCLVLCNECGFFQEQPDVAVSPFVGLIRPLITYYMRTIPITFLLLATLLSADADPAFMARPNVVLLMTDDQGWGQTGYYNHPVLKTPNLDEMASNGLRFDRFYAGAPVCSPTRASVLTGRANDRTGVFDHGHALRLQEKSVAKAFQDAGYRTGHFGKWHLNGLKGPGAPVLGEDSHHPGAFGFETWLTVANFFDINPIMSRNGQFEEFEGDSSEVIVREALQFMKDANGQGDPFFAVIWYGSPHDPFHASRPDREGFEELDEASQHHYGELVAFDRSVGTLRSTLARMGIADSTLVWFCSDNGGLARPQPGTVGGLRGHKGSVWEGGLRVPAIIEWPAGIQPRVTQFPASTMDIFPTLSALLALPEDVLLEPVDGMDLSPLFTGNPGHRPAPIPFRFRQSGALVFNQFKLVCHDREAEEFELFDLNADPAESTDIKDAVPFLFTLLTAYFREWNKSVDASVAGKDYAERFLSNSSPEPHFWWDDGRYEPYLEQWMTRPEYEKQLRKQVENEQP